jgi:hypothetical protein
MCRARKVHTGTPLFSQSNYAWGLVVNIRAIKEHHVVVRSLLTSLGSEILSIRSFDSLYVKLESSRGISHRVFYVQASASRATFFHPLVREIFADHSRAKSTLEVLEKVRGIVRNRGAKLRKISVRNPSSITLPHMNSHSVANTTVETSYVSVLASIFL